MFSKAFHGFNKVLSLTKKNKKFFDLHEYQSKDIMRKYNVRVQKGEIALNPEDAAKIAATLDPTGGLILKAQVHAGGRGKGHLTSGLKGGVKICKTPQEIANFTKQMIGYNLITHQTPKAGKRNYLAFICMFEKVCAFFLCVFLLFYLFFWGFFW